MNKKTGLIALTAVLLVGAGTASVVNYFDSASATAEVDAPVQFADSPTFENFDTSSEQTFSTVLEHTGENAVGLDDHIIVSASYDEGYETSGNLEDAIETLRLEASQVEGDGSTVYALNPEEGENQLEVVNSEEGEFEVKMGAYAQVDQDYNKDVVLKLDDAATPGNYSVELQPHVESSVE